MQSSNGNCITEEVTEMPRCCSRRIQSEVAWRVALRPLTVPAIWMAPPNSSSFSVKVVLPASGWEMMAKVRLFLIFSVIRSLDIGSFLAWVHNYVRIYKSTPASSGQGLKLPPPSVAAQKWVIRDFRARNEGFPARHDTLSALLHDTL